MALAAFPSADRFISQRSTDVGDGSEGFAEGYHGGGGGFARVPGSKVLHFSEKPPVPLAASVFDEKSQVMTASRQGVEVVHGRGGTGVNAARVIPTEPVRVLDAPEFSDDFYCELVDWSAQNQVCVGLGPSVYLWSGATGAVDELCSCPDDVVVTALSWAPDGKHLAIGVSTNCIQIWDVEAGKQLRNMKGHAGRVTCMSWNGGILSSGSKDTEIHHHDARLREHLFSRFTEHQQAVCGIQWSPDGTALASGGNDNNVLVWGGPTATMPSARLIGHTAAVKALAWCPWERNLLATGGGSADRNMRFWNTATGGCVNSVDTGSQVCALQWSLVDKEIASAHGYSKNELAIWRYPSLTKVTELSSHTSRVLSLARSPDGSTLLSAAGDETLKFWKCFTPLTSSTKAKDDLVTRTKAPGMYKTIR